MLLFSLHSELETNVKDAVQTMEKSQETDSINLENKSVVTSPISPQAPVAPSTPAGRVQTKKEQRSANTLYQELSFQVSNTKIILLIYIVCMKYKTNIL